jgi:MFS transporter, DHA2 family, multidrug resistance protein
MPVDAIGLSLLFVWVGALQLGLDLGKELDWFDSSLIVGLGCAAAAGFLLFMAWELFDNPHPVVELALFRRRNFALGTLALTLAQSIFFASNVLLPLWMQTVLGYSATLAGLLVAPMGLLAIPMSMLLARNIERLDARWLTTCALLLFAYVWWLRAEFTLQVEPWMIAVPALLQGIAMTSHFLPLTRITLDGLPPQSYAAGAGLMMFIRQTGSALGISVTITMWDLRTQVHRAELLERASIYDSATGQTLDLLQGAGLGATQSLATLDRLIEQQARMLATSDIFWASATMSLVLAGFVWHIFWASATMSLVLAGFVWLVSPKGGRITLPAMSKAVSE